MDGLISFFGSYHAIRAEMVLSRSGFRSRLVAGPRELSPNCGVALRFEYREREPIDGVHEYRPRTDAWEVPR